jgi:hypothetical protein
VINKYGLCETLHSMLDSGAVVTRGAWKKLIVRTIRTRQYTVWRMRSIMYKSMDMVLHVMDKWWLMRPAVWWTVARVNPRFTKHCKLLVRLLCGDHSLNTGRGRFHSMTKRCTLCESYEQETVQHTLFLCGALHQEQTERWHAVLAAMPRGMRQSISDMTPCEKTYFVLSGCSGQYNGEWQLIYESMSSPSIRLDGLWLGNRLRRLYEHAWRWNGPCALRGVMPYIGLCDTI